MMRCASSSLRMALGQRAVRSFFFDVQLVTTENHKTFKAEEQTTSGV